MMMMMVTTIRVNSSFLTLFFTFIQWEKKIQQIKVHTISMTDSIYLESSYIYLSTIRMK